MFFPAAASVIAACTGRTSPRTNRTSASAIAGSSRLLNTQLGWLYIQGRGWSASALMWWFTIHS